MSTQRNRTVRRNTAVVMAVLNLGLVFLVFAGVHRLESALYSRCQERVIYDARQGAAWQMEADEDRSQASYEQTNPVVAASLNRRASAAQAVVDAQVKSSCNRLRLLGLGR